MPPFEFEDWAVILLARSFRAAFDQGDFFRREAVELKDELIDLRVGGGDGVWGRGLLHCPARPAAMPSGSGALRARHPTGAPRAGGRG